MLKIKNLSVFFKAKRCLQSSFSNIKERKKETSKIVEESFRKYEQICIKEKERIKTFDKSCTKKEYMNAQMTRFVFITFGVVANIYLFSQIYHILWKFYSPYNNNSSQETSNEKNTK